MKTIADPPFCKQILRVSWVLLNFGSQGLDIGAKISRIVSEFFLPDSAKQFDVCESGFAILHQEEQEIELETGEMDFVSRTPEAAPHGVEFQIARAQQGGLFRVIHAVPA